MSNEQIEALREIIEYLAEEKNHIYNAIQVIEAYLNEE